MVLSTLQIRPYFLVLISSDIIKIAKYKLVDDLRYIESISRSMNLKQTDRSIQACPQIKSSIVLTSLIQIEEVELTMSKLSS